jgi:hypothetical protein
MGPGQDPGHQETDDRRQPESPEQHHNNQGKAEKDFKFLENLKTHDNSLLMNLLPGVTKEIPWPE